MSSETDNRRRWARAEVIIGCWTLFALFFACQRYIERAYAGRPTTWAKVLTAWAACAYLWAALTPPVLWLARRFPFERKTWTRAVPVHVTAGVLVSILQLGVYLLTLEFLLGDASHSFASLKGFKGITVAELHFNFLLYCVLVGVSHAIVYLRQQRARELAASRLEASLARAQLDALRLQLQPHFLFNTLNSISVLMHRDVAAADRMLRRLSDLLRAMLKSSGAHEVPLSQELEFLRSYLEIEQTRFSDRLEVSIYAEPAALDARVPSLILQPLIENAIRHGVAPRAEPGRIEVRAERADGSLRLQVRDDGPGLPDRVKDGLAGRVGLANTRARLEQLYGKHFSFELSNAPEGGAVVTINIPCDQPAGASQRAGE